MKNIISLLLFILFGGGLVAQGLKRPAETIKDYFIPADSKNKATFYSANNEVTKYYIKKNGNYVIYTTEIHKRLSDDNVKDTSTVIEIFQFTNTEVRMIRSVFFGRVFDYDTITIKKDFNPPQIVLKLPAMGQTVSWTNENSDGKQKKTSDWTTVTIDGEQRKAIKVLNRVWGSYSEYWGTRLGYSEEYDYYVKGIGFWKITASDGTSRTYLEFDRLYYDPEADRMHAGRN